MTQDRAVTLSAISAASAGGIGWALNVIFPDKIPPYLGIAGLILFVLGGSLFPLYWLGNKFPAFNRILPRFLQATPAVERDVWLGEAIDRAYLGEWDKPRTTRIFEKNPDTGEHHANIALAGIQQFARDGKLPVWGKQDRFRAWEPIPTEFWSAGRVDIFSYMKSGGDPSQCNTEDNKYFVPRRFYELMTSRAKVDELWPKQ